MNDYTITLVYDYFNVITVIYADDEEEAKRLVLDKLWTQEGLALSEPLEYRVQLEGVFNG